MNKMQTFVCFRGSVNFLKAFLGKGVDDGAAVSVWFVVDLDQDIATTFQVIRSCGRQHFKFGSFDIDLADIDDVFAKCLFIDLIER